MHSISKWYFDINTQKNLRVVIPPFLCLLRAGKSKIKSIMADRNWGRLERAFPA